jgi:excisionase family DNA binding protein
MQDAQLPALMTVKEAAEYLRVSERTIRRWAEENLLDYVRVGYEYRIVQDSLPKFPIQEKNLGKKSAEI